MYSFEPTDEQKMLVDAVSRYAISDLRPKAHDADEEAALPRALVEKGWELGYLQASVPEAYGGFGEHSAVTGVLAMEELAYGDLAGALAIQTPGLFALPILMAGNEEQKERYIPPVIEAEWQPYTAALIEPTLIFDPEELQTTAVEDGDDYILNGVKTYVPYAPEAPAMIVYANVDQAGTQGFIIPQGATGLEVGERQKLLGLNALPVYHLRLNQVRIPKTHRLGGPAGHSFAPILDSARVAMSAMGVGLARAAFEYSRDYAKEREVFGVKVAQKQVIAFMLAEMAIEVEAMRILNWEAAWMLDQGKPEASQQAYMAALGVGDMAMMVTDRAVQILGGHGYIREFPVEMWMRNGRGIATLVGLGMA